MSSHSKAHYASTLSIEGGPWPEEQARPLVPVRVDESHGSISEDGGARRPAIVLEKVSKTYKVEEMEVSALKELSLTIELSEVTVILGPSGSGKTTLLNLIGGIDTPTSGRISVLGREIQELDQKELTRFRQGNIGFVFQFFNLIPNLTVRENVEFVLEYVMDLPREDVRAKAQDMLEKVGLSNRGDHFPCQLSGGEQQRVAIARAVAKDPHILLADEPTGELDYQTGKMIMGLLTALASDGRTVVIVTHNQELARAAHQVVRLRDGAVVKIERNNAPLKASELEW